MIGSERFIAPQGQDIAAPASAFEPKRILCAVDLSPMSSAVLKWARLFAEAYQARVNVAHAETANYPAYFLPSQDKGLTAEAEQRRAFLSHAIATVVQDALGSSINTENTILDGYPAEAILRYATSSKPDLIVLGSHGHSGLNRLRLGSVVETVARSTPIPALVARGRADGLAPRVSRVLCPISFAESAHRCLEQAAEVARAFRAQLVALHTIEDANLDLNAAQQALCRWVPSEVRSRCDVIEVVRRGSAAEQILLAAEEQAIDLIVIDAGRRPLLKLAVAGSVAEHVIRHAESAVLVFPSENGAAT